MAWHNHEENIKKAKQLLPFLASKTLDFEESLNLYDLLRSMIADAETGHARIKELKGMLSIGAQVGRMFDEQGYKAIIEIKGDQIRELKVENEKLKHERDQTGNCRVLFRQTLDMIQVFCKQQLEREREIFKDSEANPCPKQ